MVFCLCCSGQLDELNYIDQFIGNNLLHCNKCNHIQILKYPTVETLLEYYKNKYSANRKSILTKKYLRIMEKRAISQVKYISKIIRINEKNIVDIGCGYGQLLKVLKENGCKIMGYDYDPEAVNYCNENDVRAKHISDKESITIGETDIVILSHVLEHLDNPVETLKYIKNNSKYIFIEVPTYDHRISEQFIEQEGHLNFFTLSSLQKLLEKLSFEIIDIGSYGPAMDMFWRSRFKLFKYLYRVFKRDYFFDAYNVKCHEGIWIRVLVRC